MTIDAVKNLTALMRQCDLKERDSQNRMMVLVYHAAQKNKIACIEAPTGTGKTLGYLLPLLLAKSEKQTIVVSTATIALQEQLLKQDIPLASKILNRRVSVVLAKGRRRYVCHSRLLTEDELVDHEMDEHKVMLSSLRKELLSHRWSGERDHSEEKIHPDLWQRISVDGSQCSGSRCDYFHDCVFFKKRKAMQDADVVIANHNLLLSDLSLGGGVLLPDMKKTLYVLDECHQFSEKALDHFILQVSKQHTLDWLNLTNKALNKVSKSVSINHSASKTINDATRMMVDIWGTIDSIIESNQAKFVEHTWRWTATNQEFVEHANLMTHYANQFLQSIEYVLDTVKKTHDDKSFIDPKQGKVLSAAVTHFQFIADRAAALIEVFVMLTKEVSDKGVPIARWVEEKTIFHDGEHIKNYTLYAAPINVSETMNQLFWSEVQNTVVLCSATIRALGTFDDYLRKVGLLSNPLVMTESLPSVFQYDQSILFIPKMQHDPGVGSAKLHIEEASRLLPQIIAPKGTLVLFTSRSAMRETLLLMPSDIKHDILCQDDYEKKKLLEKHQERIHDNHRSIIFGLSSFAEGIDLPGDLCQHVIIHKLPFVVPTHPMYLTRQEWLKQHGKNAFTLITLPETSMKLTQYIGRLLRTEKDRGMVTILDKRLYSKQYGPQLLNNMPPFVKLVNVDMGELKKQKNYRLWE